MEYNCSLFSTYLHIYLFCYFFSLRMFVNYFYFPVKILSMLVYVTLWQNVFWIKCLMVSIQRPHTACLE